MAAPSPDVLDQILTLQLAVAWAGEGSCEPARLGWWKTDLIDLEGGGDLLQRLLPRTHEWASLQAVREAAVTTEATLRTALGNSAVRTLFHLGDDVDERLRERLGQLKRRGDAPRDALPGLPDLKAAFSQDTFAQFVSSAGRVEASPVPGGRELAGEAPPEIALLAQRLASALVPFVKPYPLPFYRGRA